MAKQSMKRPDVTHTQPRNAAGPVPEIQGRAKRGKSKANPVVAGTNGVNQKVFHTERPIPSGVYPAVDTDLGRDNLENDIPAADLTEL